ncbi:hypothetical protein [Mesorhizobium sp.]|uniref:hypothetical protein n=1 Tax=Mesorhizobium sp. TaxID=1871066 RepID=UPI000FE94540|nr:hypothetical protein [Mesorhizobium sp.]RWO81033.1 MAG: hypothetical protein EOQ96_25695 [Mesorhizobium sp.]
MLDIPKETAARIVDAIAMAIDGKPCSAECFNPSPYVNLADYDNWGRDNSASKNVALRTRALLVAYIVFSGGRIPLRGIEMQGTYFRPEAEVAGILVNKGYLTVNESSGEFLVTQSGWAFVAEALERLG